MRFSVAFSSTHNIKKCNNELVKLSCTHLNISVNWISLSWDIQLVRLINAILQLHKKKVIFEARFGFQILSLKVAKKFQEESKVIILVSN